MWWLNSANLKDAEEQLLSAEELVATFQRTLPQEVSEGRILRCVWQRIRDPLRHSLWKLGLADLPAVGTGQLWNLQRILDKEIPKLRRLASPSHHRSTKTDDRWWMGGD